MNESIMVARLETLRIEHRDLDREIATIAAVPVLDQLRLARLKKRKLQIKDEIARLGASLVPDIIA